MHNQKRRDKAENPVMISIEPIFEYCA